MRKPVIVSLAVNKDFESFLDTKPDLTQMVDWLFENLGKEELDRFYEVYFFDDVEICENCGAFLSGIV